MKDYEKEEITMECEQALSLISAALDGEITPEEREQLNSHLDRCAECRAIADDFGLISAALTEEIELPVGLTEHMRAAVKDTSQNRKRTFLRRYGSLAAMLAIVLSLGAIVMSGAGGRNDVALFSGMGSAKVLEGAAAVRDGLIITGTSAGCAIPFGLALVAALKGEETAKTVAEQIVIR